MTTTTLHKSHALPSEKLLWNSIEALLQLVAEQIPGFEHIANADLALKSLPLATGEFGTALNHLHNAEKYITEGEWGAAKYELQLLQKSFFGASKTPKSGEAKFEYHHSTSDV